MASIHRPCATTTVNKYFVQLIDSATLDHIRIPIPFFNRYVSREPRGENVTLVSDEFSGEWNVKREGAILTDGWSEFAKSHDLQVGDYVLFKHQRDSVFKVTPLGPSGSQIIYEKSSQEGTEKEAANSSMPKAKQKEVRKNEENSERANRKAQTGKRATGNLSAPSKKPKQQKTTMNMETNSFYRTVTKSNLDRNEVYIPKTFATMNSLIERKASEVSLVNSQGIVWTSTLKYCTDGRLKISGTWRDFCSANNLDAGDNCKFRLGSDTVHVLLEFIESSTDDEKCANGMNRHVHHKVCKVSEEKEKSSEGRKRASGETIEDKERIMDTCFGTTIERGQPSKVLSSNTRELDFW